MDNPEILFEDNHLFIGVKPAGLLTQDSGTGRPNFEDQCRHYLKIRDQKSGNAFLHAIHRLDAVASGIVVMAKSQKALKRLHQAMRQGQIEKTYHAWVTGKTLPEQGELHHYLKHTAHKALVFDAAKRGAKESRLTFRTLKTEGGHTLLEIQLHTGRYHQIRSQLAHVGHPILGDKPYGGLPWTQSGIALYHYSVSLPHPVSGTQLVFQLKNSS